MNIAKLSCLSGVMLAHLLHTRLKEYLNLFNILTDFIGCRNPKKKKIVANPNCQPFYKTQIPNFAICNQPRQP